MKIEAYIRALVRASVDAQPVVRAQVPNTLYIYDIISSFYGVTALAVAAALSGMKGPLTLRINSPGGEVLEGVAIRNLLAEYARTKGTITTFIDGVAASMATVIPMSLGSIIMADSAMMMIHRAHAGMYGTAEDHRSIGLLMDKTEGVAMLAAYEGQTKKSRAELLEMMDKETWMTADEALEHGFVSAITKTDEDLQGLRAAAQRFDLRALGRFPERVAARLDAGAPAQVEPVRHFVLSHD